MGIILLNKKEGITSFDALRDIKRSLGTGKVGHTGTLDKFASGLLIVLTENALKLSRWFTHLDKHYTGKIKFGEETDTLDPEGEIIARASVPTRGQVESVLNSFTGEIQQAPPAYSAIHINGKRASALAREGIVPQMKKKPVTIYKLKLTSWEPPFARIKAHCSSGTYIRSLARDIALAVESRGHLVELTRTQVGKFTHTEASNQRFGSNGGHGEEDKFFISPINKNVISQLGLPIIDVTQEEVQHIRHGKSLNQIINKKTSLLLRVLCFPQGSDTSVPPCEKNNQKYFAIFCEEELIAIIENDKNNWKYSCVMSIL